MEESVLDRVRRLLRTAQIEFREIDHAPTFTSEESAAARGEPLGVGAKALLVKIDESFKLFVLPADRKFDSATVKMHFKAKKTRFATPEELQHLTGLVPGSVPPFGKPVFELELCADESIGVQFERVAFNAGSLTHSIVMRASDWKRIANPVLFSFAK